MYLDDDLLISYDDLSTVNCPLNTKEYPDGDYVLTMIASGRNGNQSTATRHITIDNTAPEVSIIYPTGGETFTSYFSIIFSASDDNGFGNTPYEIRIGGEYYNYVTNTCTEQEVSPVSFPNGLYEIEFIATDASGKSNSTSVGCDLNLM